MGNPSQVDALFSSRRLDGLARRLAVGARRAPSRSIHGRDRAAAAIRSRREPRRQRHATPAAGGMAMGAVGTRWAVGTARHTTGSTFDHLIAA